MEGSVETTRIERDLEATRARLDATIGALQQKLSPGQLLDQSLAYLKEGGGGEFVHNLKLNVQTHPMPVALIGVGLAWLMMSGNGRSSGTAYVSTGPYPDEREDWTGHYGDDDDAVSRAEYAAAGVKRTASETAEAFQERLYAAKGAALGVSRNVGEALSEFSSRVDAAMHAAAQTGKAAARRVGSAAGSAAHAARGAGSSAIHAARYAGSGAAGAASRAAGYLQDQPLLMGALGVSVGALLAAILPPTRTEDELMGETADALRSRASGAAEAAISSGARIADEAMAAGTESARREGLTTADARTAASNAGPKVAQAAAGVRHVVEDTARAGRSALESELGREEAAKRQQQGPIRGE